MQPRPVCTVAQLLFTAPPALSFARLVADLEAAFQNCPAEGRHLQWDHDDLAILDVQASRIIISYDAGLTGDHRACLSIGVGFGPGTGEPGLAQRQDTVSRMIADRITQRYNPDATLWHHSALPLTPALLDELTDSLPATACDVAQREAARAEGMARLRAGLGQRKLAANDNPALPAQMEDELARVRAALYSDEGGQMALPSVALRLAAHAVNATLVVIALPVGAAVMTYGLVRGANLRASARLLALVGIAIGARDAAAARDMLPWI